MLINISYGCGYGRHKDTIEVKDDATDDDIDKHVAEVMAEKFDWGWRKAD